MYYKEVHDACIKIQGKKIKLPISQFGEICLKHWQWQPSLTIKVEAFFLK